MSAGRPVADDNDADAIGVKEKIIRDRNRLRRPIENATMEEEKWRSVVCGQ